METEQLVRWLFVVAGLGAGVGLLVVRVDPEELRGKVRTNPGLALYRFRVVRYGVAAVCLIGAFLALPH